ncbi:heme exporter protein CcmB [Pseudomonas sp. DTU_2021_1001937_2_SI_NGA_ILE_001]|uniref:heme exporter protein CcmB n=1 Tax=Pseudomonas sp. DTU_2021_1001937_2_SI_NGA_ILE_001 TaxID=3077589 RepID=UPI0025F15968|nr:heme exporter protein CcmB [Pseudomonas sp. DTU_2021_1001937_2_SI_NGA_ILE_001]WNW11106.1 heme exporter protein CcmB [Pseudomonas sp. DTU_2021_1001937_2_SI_NGA_ILE_001]
MTHAFTLLLLRELRLLSRRPAELLNPLVFFAIVIALFPLAVGPEAGLLRTLAPGLVWVAALLAVLLSLDGLFRSDFEDGSLEQWVLSPHPLALMVLAKVLAHWLFSGLALVLMAPVLALMLGLPGECLGVLVASLLLGTPVLSLLGAVGAALTVGLKRGGLLLALLILPLYIPVLILGSGALQAALQGMPATGYLLWLASLAALALTLTPFAIAEGLKISVAE